MANCRECGKQFKSQRAYEESYDGFCFSCAMSMEEYNPYGYMVAGNVEDRKRQYDKRMKKNAKSNNG